LLLDEPTNHLDAESVLWLEQHLAKYPGTVVAITHDRYFLDNVAQWILELDRGRAYPYEGNYPPTREEGGLRSRGRGRQGKAPHRRAGVVRSSPGPGKKRSGWTGHEMAAEAEKTRKLTSRRSRSRRARLATVIEAHT
jgi:ATPase subunit of ABC transporter with duplicated ATPase domains